MDDMEEIELSTREMFEYMYKRPGVITALDYRPGEIWLTLPQAGWRLRTHKNGRRAYRQLVRLWDHRYVVTLPDKEGKDLWRRVSGERWLYLVEE